MSAKYSQFSIPASDGQLIRGHFHNTGNGCVGVFLHGLLSNCDGTKSTALWHHAELKNRSWIRFDMRAHGISDGVFEEFTISRAMEDVKNVFSLLENRPAVMVGSSMGGWVAAEAALIPELNVCGMVILAPAFGFMGTLFDSAPKSEQEQWRASGEKFFESPYPDSDFVLSYAAVTDSRQYDLFSRPVSYKFPVKILHGALDDVVPPDQSLQFKQHASSSDIEVKIFPDGDHPLSEKIDDLIVAVDQVWPPNPN